MSAETITAGTLRLPGAALHFEVAGQGPAVVLVHGFGLDMRMWDPQLTRLAAGFQIIRYDCRGFGASGPFDPGVRYTHAGDLLALLDHLSIRRAALAGLSFGGRVVMQTALLAPDRAWALVLADAVLDGVPWDAASLAGLDEVGRQVALGGVPAAQQAWLGHPLFAAARQRPDLAVQLANMVRGYPGQHWLGLDPHQPEQRPLIESLAELTMPTLVITGELDVPGFRAMSRVLADGIPAAEAVQVPAAGHLVNMEQPAIFNQLLTAFLDERCPALP